MLNKDPNEIYKKIHQAIQKCITLIEKQTHKYLLNIKPMAPKHNVNLKHNLFKLPYTYNTQNSQEIAEELLKLQIIGNIRIITLHIKDMYVNLPI